MQVGIRGGDQPDVHFNLFIRAEPRDLAIFKDAEQFDLRLHRHLAHFIEKQRSAVGILELSDPLGGRSRERTRFVAEQLALQNALGQGGDDERDERLVLAFAVVMECPRGEFLPRATLAQDQDRAVGRSNAAELLHHAVHRETVADHPFVAEFLIETLAEFRVLAEQADSCGSFLHRVTQLSDVERLGEIRVNAMLSRRDGRLDGGVSRQQDDLGVGQFLLRLAEDFEAVQIVHHQVGDNDIVGLTFDQRRGPRTRVGHGAVVSDATQALGHSLCVSLIVVHDQDANRDAQQFDRCGLFPRHPSSPARNLNNSFAPEKALFG